jgi:CheY-like chemotaxis protein
MSEVKISLLIVDDEPEILDIMQDLIMNLNINVCISIQLASDVPEALAKTNKVTHAFIDGLEGKGDLLASVLKPIGIKCYRFSGDTGRFDRSLYDGILSKPFDIEQIAEVLK